MEVMVHRQQALALVLPPLVALVLLELYKLEAVTPVKLVQAMQLLLAGLRF
jgi:hypothetical protein